MTTRHVGALALALAIVAGACGAPSDATPPVPSPTRPPTRPPAIEDLRVTAAGWATDFSRASVHLGDFTAGGPPRDGIPAIDDPVIESIAAAQAWLAPTSPVIAVEISGDARAYPLAILVWHEIVNDTLGGGPVVVTFCPLCHTALAYERAVDGEVLDFGTTGNLRYLDLVMYDRQAESWWQQATGEAIVGTRTGERLRFLASQLISLADFAAAHPDGDVLSRETGITRPYGENPYPGLDRADRREHAYVNQVDHRLEAKTRVVTRELADGPLAVPYPTLEDERVVEIGRDPDPLVIVWQGGTTSALDRDRVDLGRDVGATGVFRPIVEGRRLAFAPPGPADGVAAMVDAQTGSAWSIAGRAIAGPLAGARLEAVPHGDHFWCAWASFQPDTTIWGGDARWVRGPLATNRATDPTTSTSTSRNDRARISRSAASESSMLSNPPWRLKTRSTNRDSRVCEPDAPSTVAPKSTPVGARTAATLATAAALRSIGPGRQCSTR